MRLFLLAVLLISPSLFAADPADKKGPERYRPSWPTPDQVGPMLGAVSPTNAVVWFRPATGVESVRLRYGLDESVKEDAGVVTPDPAHDRCVRWTLRGLSIQTAFRYRIEDAKDGRLLSGPHTFWTAPALDAQDLQAVVFGSCADESDATGKLWSTVLARNPLAVVLLGDTPYIDRTTTDWQRIRHRDFLGAPGLRDLLPRIPLYSVWDDHDFGEDNADGHLSGKENSLAVFKDYRVNPSYGDGNAGLYHRFQVGLFDVFVLDTRYFANLGNNPDNPGVVSALGTAQWNWLTEGLKSSGYPFKVLATGMVWHDWKNAGKKDTWNNYAGEREALFRFIGREKISGVVCVGGDVHQSALVRMPTREMAGYDIFAATISPLNARSIKGDGMPSPEEGLVWKMTDPHLFLSLGAVTTEDDEKVIEFLFVNGEGKRIFESQEKLYRLTAGGKRKK